MGGKKEIYQYIRFFHGALQLLVSGASSPTLTWIIKDHKMILVWCCCCHCTYNN